MSCAFKVPVYHSGVRYMVPCGQCMSCRIVYQQQVLFAVNIAIQDAYRAGLGCSFVTLTYDDDSVPLANNAIPTLVKRDVQLFNKRFRQYIKRNLRLPISYKYLISGEYGDTTNRPHYHALFIGLSDVIASECRHSWDYGFPQVGTLRPGGARYVLKYVTKSAKGLKAKELYDDVGIERPFLLRSRGMADSFLNTNYESITSNDYKYMSKGKLVRIPKYFQRRLGVRKIQDVNSLHSIIKAAAVCELPVFHFLHNDAVRRELSLVSDARSKGIPVDDIAARSLSYINNVENFSTFFQNIVDKVPF